MVLEQLGDEHCDRQKKETQSIVLQQLAHSSDHYIRLDVDPFIPYNLLQLTLPRLTTPHC